MIHLVNREAFGRIGDPGRHGFYSGLLPMVARQPAVALLYPRAPDDASAFYEQASRIEADYSECSCGAPDATRRALLNLCASRIAVLTGNTAAMREIAALIEEMWIRLNLGARVSAIARARGQEPVAPPVKAGVADRRTTLPPLHKSFEGISPLAKTAGLFLSPGNWIELSSKEYADFESAGGVKVPKGERIYQGGQVELCGLTWQSIAGVTQGRVYKIASKTRFSAHEAPQIVAAVVDYFSTELGAGPTREAAQGIHRWDTTHGSVVLEEASIGDESVANVYLIATTPEASKAPESLSPVVKFWFVSVMIVGSAILALAPIFALAPYNSPTGHSTEAAARSETMHESDPGDREVQKFPGTVVVPVPPKSTPASPRHDTMPLPRRATAPADADIARIEALDALTGWRAPSGAKQGRWNSMRLGLTRAQVEELLGPPISQEIESSVQNVELWRYRAGDGRYGSPGTIEFRNGRVSGWKDPAEAKVVRGPHETAAIDSLKRLRPTLKQGSSPALVDAWNEMEIALMNAGFGNPDVQVASVRNLVTGPLSASASYVEALGLKLDAAVSFREQYYRNINPEQLKQLRKEDPTGEVEASLFNIALKQYALRQRHPEIQH